MQIIPRWLYVMLLAMAIVVASCHAIEQVPPTPLSVPATPVLIPTAINQQTSTISETVSLLPTVTPTPIPTATVRSTAANVLPAPLYFLGEDQQIWLLEHDGGVTQLTSEAFPISAYDISPVHGRLTFVTNNQLIEFDPITKKRAIKVEGGPLPAKDSDGFYSIEDIATIILGVPSYSPNGLQIAFTLAGVNLVDSGLETASLPSRLVGNTLFDMAEHVALTGKIDITDNVEQIRLYGSRLDESMVSWSPDGKKLLLRYLGWEWLGYDLYDLTTDSIRAVPIGMFGEWTWAKDGESAIIAHGGQGGPFHTGLYILDLDTMTSEQFDLDALGVSNEANPFTPLARVAYEYSDSRIAFFMGTRFLRQDGQSLAYYSLAEIDPVTNSVFWSDVTEFRQEFELGEVLWAEDGSGFINSHSPNSHQWMSSEGSTTIDLSIHGSSLHWGSTATAHSLTIPTPTPAFSQTNKQATDQQTTKKQVSDEEMATNLARIAQCRTVKGLSIYTKFYCFGFNFELLISGLRTTADEAHLLLLPADSNSLDRQYPEDAFVEIDIRPVSFATDPIQNENDSNCRRQPSQHPIAFDDASIAINRYQVVLTEYHCGQEALLLKELLIGQPTSPTVRVTVAALSGTDSAMFDKIFNALIESFAFYNSDQWAFPVPTNEASAFTQPPTATPIIMSGTPVPNIVEQIGDYTLRIWNGFNYPVHLPDHGYYGTATLTHVDSRELIIPDADLVQPIPVSDINGDGYPDVALRLNVGGSHCCIGTVVYTLDDGPTRLLETFDPGRPMYAGDFQDLDQDGIYEFITGDDIGGCNGSRTALTVLRYDPAQGYIGSGYRFPQAYEDTLARLLAYVDKSSDHCDLSTIAFNYLYMGMPIEAWANFTRLNRTNQDIFSEHEWTERRALSGKFFAAKPPGIQIIEDFASAQGENVIQPYQMNDADGASQVVTSVMDMDEYAKDKKFLALDYRINGQMGQRYVGLERCFDQTQDWSQTSILDTAIRNPTDHPVTFFLQFGEGKRCGTEPFTGEVWRMAVTLQPNESQVLTVPLNSRDHFARTDWSAQQNGEIDLQQIGYFAFGVETDEPQEGVLNVSPIRLWP